MDLLFTNKNKQAPSYLGPLGVEQACLDGVVQGSLVLSQFEVGGRAVAVEDAVLRVGAQGLSVQLHGRLEVALLARLVAPPHLLHELSFAQSGSFGRHVHRPAQRPRPEQRKLPSSEMTVSRVSGHQMHCINVMLLASTAAMGAHGLRHIFSFMKQVHSQSTIFHTKTFYISPLYLC